MNQSPSITDLETPRCPLCNALDELPAYSGDQFAPYGVKICRCCGLLFLSPRLNETAMLSHYASATYFSGDTHGYGDYAAQEPALRATFKKFLHTLSRRGIGGEHLIEIGCGHGYLLDEARSYFKLRHGTDYSPAAVEIARHHAETIYQGGLEAIPADLQVDCIIATQVIEHVYQPHHFIRTLVAHLRPGGHLVIATPDAGTFWRPLMRRRWPSFKLPEHILYFTQATLTRLMHESGLKDLQIIPYPHAFPLPLIAKKLGFPLPSILNNFSLWLPGTTLAIAGVAP